MLLVNSIFVFLEETVSGVGTLLSGFQGVVSVF